MPTDPMFSAKDRALAALETLRANDTFPGLLHHLAKRFVSVAHHHVESTPWYLSRANDLRASSVACHAQPTHATGRAHTGASFLQIDVELSGINGLHGVTTNPVTAIGQIDFDGRHEPVVNAFVPLDRALHVLVAQDLSADHSRIEQMSIDGWLHAVRNVQYVTPTRLQGFLQRASSVRNIIGKIVIGDERIVGHLGNVETRRRTRCEEMGLSVHVLSTDASRNDDCDVVTAAAAATAAIITSFRHPLYLIEKVNLALERGRWCVPCEIRMSFGVILVERL